MRLNTPPHHAPCLREPRVLVPGKALRAPAAPGSTPPALLSSSRSGYLQGTSTVICAVCPTPRRRQTG
ncbi:hypothetical protein NDU88_004511 [Pleurodeles waltl]|uniref:Uncharacterized protein n=1 Tax=Pleurodeles waltl TaxID=8319 RepID=A0AAV7MTN6_PLEWA|nr:hypothetical protein NDU88_004511 [Pleurodeles waltl]